MTPTTEALIRLEERALIAEHLAKIPKCKIAAKEVFRTIRHGQMKLSYAGRCQTPVKPHPHAASRTTESPLIGFVIALSIMGAVMIVPAFVRYGVEVVGYLGGFSGG